MAFVKGEKPRNASYAKGGSVVGRSSSFVKGKEVSSKKVDFIGSKDEFREATNKASDENFGKK
jgi:hypothetical protein